MEYREIYDYTYNNAVLVLERLIVLSLKSGKEKNRRYSKIHFNILNGITEYLQEGYIQKFKKNESKSYSVFLERNSLYEGSELDVVVWVLEDEVKNAFSGHTYKSYKHFIRDLAISNALLDMYQKFSQSESYTLLVYEQNRYDLFCLKNFELDTFKISKGYKEMVDVKYPNGISESEIITDVKGKVAVSKKVDYSNQNEITLEKIKAFNDNEKALIISVFYNLVNNKKASEIKLTEFTKLLKIAGSYEDVSIFTDKSESNTFYGKINKGFNYYKGNSPLVLIDSTLTKLEVFDLKFIYEALHREKTKLLLEKNKKS